MIGDRDDDLAHSVVSLTLGDRAVRTYPALLSTEAAAMAWAREGAPSGAVVVADYQASPRGRGGLPWSVTAGRGLGFTLLARPELPPEREGWPYVPVLLGLLDAVDAVGVTRVDAVDAFLEWPDTVRTGAGVAQARTGVYVELGPARTEWVSVTVLLEDAGPPRAPLLAATVEALERRLGEPVEQVLGDYLARCSTLGRQCRARMIPMGPGGPEVNGEAVDVLADGSLVLLTGRGNRVAVPPQNLGLLEDPQGPIAPPERLFGQTWLSPHALRRPGR